MLKMWTKLLPFFVVEWLAKKSESYDISINPNAKKPDIIQIVRPYHGVYIEPNYRQRVINQKIDALHK